MYRKPEPFKYLTRSSNGFRTENWQLISPWNLPTQAKICTCTRPKLHSRKGRMYQVARGHSMFLSFITCILNGNVTLAGFLWDRTAIMSHYEIMFSLRLSLRLKSRLSLINLELKLHCLLEHQILSLSPVRIKHFLLNPSGTYLAYC